MALLGSGFDPGVTNVYTALAAKKYLDVVEEIDIIDANAGSHGQPFATNFNPEINIREVTATCRHWENGQWVESPPLTTKHSFDFPEGIGPMNIYRLYHEEMESLVKHIPTIKKAQFWMTFSDNYLKHLEVLQNVGMTRIDEVEFNGQKIVPIQFLKALLPDPGSLGPLTKGKTCIGVIARGIKDGQRKQVYIYNICDHEACYKEVQSQAISYTTGVPAVVGAIMMLTGKWRGRRRLEHGAVRSGAVPGRAGADGTADSRRRRRRMAGAVTSVTENPWKAGWQSTISCRHEGLHEQRLRPHSCA